MSTKVQVSSEFRKRVFVSVLTLVFFIITYLVLLLATAALTAACWYYGVKLMLFTINIMTLAAGVGIISFGVLIFIFLIKFLFNWHKVDRSNFYEVSRQVEPRLFKMVDELVQEVGTQFPKKIYISAEVNASVFYDSSFWSMFFPIRKNLHIGLGLVNSVTETELKAILAHEFGHFSQRSMKLGSYVYQVNQVIFNMLFDNDTFVTVARDWSKVHGVVELFVNLALGAIGGIQWLLQKLYNVVNIPYLALSREMEFHADRIAAMVVGSDPLMSSLLRMELADTALNKVYTFFDEKRDTKAQSANLYPNQLFVMQYLGQQRQLDFRSGLPMVTLDFIRKFRQSKLVVADQWSSHPSNQERFDQLLRLAIPSKETDEPANHVFSHISELQEIVTKDLFKRADYNDGPIISEEEFRQAYADADGNESYPSIFNGYYDHKSPQRFQQDELIAIDLLGAPADLFNNNCLNSIYAAMSLQNDHALLQQISDKSLKLRTFDYDGVKYKQHEATQLAVAVKDEYDKQIELLRINDLKIYSLLHHNAIKSDSLGKVEELFILFEDIDNHYAEYMQLYYDLNEGLRFTAFDNIISIIHENFEKLAPKEESLKSIINQLIQQLGDEVQLPIDAKANFEHYTTNTLEYFGVTVYNNKNLAVFRKAVDDFPALLSKGYVLLKRKLLQRIYQLLFDADNVNP